MAEQTRAIVESVKPLRTAKDYMDRMAELWTLSVTKQMEPREITASCRVAEHYLDPLRLLIQYKRVVKSKPFQNQPEQPEPAADEEDMGTLREFFGISKPQRGRAKKKIA